MINSLRIKIRIPEKMNPRNGLYFAGFDQVDRLRALKRIGIEGLNCAKHPTQDGLQAMINLELFKDSNEAGLFETMTEANCVVVKGEVDGRFFYPGLYPNIC
jgi:hypothetical protein